ncbi:MAG: tetratricopeptide repeat protein, partial [Leptospiraceae bacterium]|nr:tetratricopeptide repeat protein [Leptospiraceae bacterium]
EISYSPDELAQIAELTGSFNKAPGQINILEDDLPEPEASETGDEIPGDFSDNDPLAEDSGESGGDLDDFLPDTSTSSTPKVDLSKFADLDDEFSELTSGGSAQTDISTGEETAVDLDSLDPFAEDLSTPVDTDSGEDSTSTGETDTGDLDFNLQDNVSEPGEIADFELPDTGVTADEPGTDLGDSPDFGAGDEPQLADSGASDVNLDDLDFGNTDTDADLNDSPDLTATEAGADNFGGDDFSSGADFETPLDSDDIAPPDFGDLGDLPETSDQDTGLELDTNLEPGDVEPPTFDDVSLDTDFGGTNDDFGATDFDTPDLGTPDAPDLDDLNLSGGSDDALGEDEEITGPPDLDDLSPEVVLGSSAGTSGEATSMQGLDLASDLEDLRSERTGEMFSDEDIRRLRDTLRGFPPLLRRAIIDTIIEDKIEPEQIKDLVGQIITGTQPEAIQIWLEEATGKSIKDLAPEIPKGGSKTVLARPQYSDTGMQRQARLVRLTQFSAIAAVALLVLGTTLWFTVAKPWLYNKKVAQGRAMILNPVEGSEQKAEELFQEALEYYREKPHAYLQYADAYRLRGKYDEAFEKLFGKVQLLKTGKEIRMSGQEVRSSMDFWSRLQKVPVSGWQDQKKSIIQLDGIPWKMDSAGAYLVNRLAGNKDSANVLLALGAFHSNPARRFVRHGLRNNLLGLDYYRRVLTFETQTPMFGREEAASAAVMGIGDVYYNQQEYYKALDYFDRIVKTDPYDIAGQTGILKTLIKIYRDSGDPRLVIQQHSVVKHTLKIEDKLPLFLLARLAAFYNDLPMRDELRIKYNVAPDDPVNGRALKERSADLLNHMFSKTEEDIYGNKKRGNMFAEGFYQRARYYRNDAGQIRMALSQFEYAYQYDPRHFLALNDRAELLMKLRDFTGAIEHLKLANEQISPDKLEMLGDRPEDETLLEADLGVIPFNMGKAMYLSLISELGNPQAWLKMDEVDRYQNAQESGAAAFAAQLDRIEGWFVKADDLGLQDEAVRAQMYYYSGWADYVRKNYKRALSYWESVPLEQQKRYPHLELSKSHALFQIELQNEKERENYLTAAEGILIYLHEIYRARSEEILRPSGANPEHSMVFARNAVIVNNLGAVYEILGNEKDSLQMYWRSVEYGKKIGRENEIAQLNIKLHFQRDGLTGQEKFPVLMDFIPPTLSEDDLLNQ